MTTVDGLFGAGDAVGGAINPVVLTVYVFLQDLRTSLIPAITIPVALVGTLGVMLALGADGIYIKMK